MGTPGLGNPTLGAHCCRFFDDFATAVTVHLICRRFTTRPRSRRRLRGGGRSFLVIARPGCTSTTLRTTTRLPAPFTTAGVAPAVAAVRLRTTAVASPAIARPLAVATVGVAAALRTAATASPAIARLPTAATIGPATALRTPAVASPVTARPPTVSTTGAVTLVVPPTTALPPGEVTRTPRGITFLPLRIVAAAIPAVLAAAARGLRGASRRPAVVRRIVVRRTVTFVRSTVRTVRRPRIDEVPATPALLFPRRRSTTVGHQFWPLSAPVRPHSIRTH